MDLFRGNEFGPSTAYTLPIVRLLEDTSIGGPTFWLPCCCFFRGCPRLVVLKGNPQENRKAPFGKVGKSDQLGLRNINDSQADDLMPP